MSSSKSFYGLVLPNAKALALNPSGRSWNACGWDDNMAKYVGKVIKILHVDRNGDFCQSSEGIDGYGFYWPKGSIVRVNMTPAQYDIYRGKKSLPEAVEKALAESQYADDEGVRSLLLAVDKVYKRKDRKV